ncbi:gamma-butyrobetaine dioxygenase-like [Actinia tenebrosa]|uniref:Gamma-butyrobetaine dioxygenase-like n=1 Tax=Actinia tenebrosa TaxID=6105 RepID=A0A6P8ITZ2_ACTTE|nr:gamma-butyrobetaine dioxygenase-like [Actinia tenebrosa]
MLASRVSYLARASRLVKHSRLLSTIANVKEQKSLVTEVHKKDSMLHVHWNDQSVSRFPYIYLRDICNCPKCLDAKSFQRKLDIVGQIDLNIQAKSVEVTQDGQKVQISWPDNHVSEFDSRWLHQNKLKERGDVVDETKGIARESVTLWDRKQMQDKLPRFIFEDVLRKDEVLYNWLFTLHEFGITLLVDAPTNSDPIAALVLAQRVGYNKATHYGFKFDVHAKFDANNLAYTTEYLPLHCDIPTAKNYPGVQILHCLEQVPTKGGSNQFVDGFKIAQDFKNKEPELYDVLSKTPIPYVDIGADVFGDFHLKNTWPVIELDHNKKIRRFTYNNHVRDYHLTSPPEKVCDIYRGYMLLGQMMRDPENKIDQKLQKGEMVTFNNSRVLHGRSEFTPTRAGNRHLQGTYLDWDLIYARLRSLGQSLGRPFNE